MNMDDEVKAKVVVHGAYDPSVSRVVEVLLQSTCSESIPKVEGEVRSYLETSCTNYVTGPLSFSGNLYLVQCVSSVIICDIPDSVEQVPFWKAELAIHVFTLNQEGSAAESLDGTDDVTAFHEWMLPCSEFYPLWDQYAILSQFTVVWCTTRTSKRTC